MNIEYIIKKSPIPILFIDTFALISYAKGDNGKISKLLDKASEKVKEGKLICPTSDQFEEIDAREYKMAKNKSVLHFYDMKFGNRGLIHKKQLLNFMKCYKDNIKKVSILYSEGFDEDPVSKFKKVLSDEFHIYFENPLPDEITRIDRINRKNFVQTCTNWYTENGTSDIENEMKEYPKKKVKMVQENIQRVKKFQDIYPQGIDYWLQIRDPVYKVFKQVFNDGSPNDYIDFINSDWYRYLPFEYISELIYANFLSKNPAKSMVKGKYGEAMDILQISSYMPYCNYMLIDRAQYNLLKEYGIDQLFETKIFAMKNYEELFALLEAI